MYVDFVKFENWLQKQKLCSATIQAYKNQIEGLYKKIPDYLLETDDIVFLIALYTEYLNKNYLLDRVTIGSAIYYFKEITAFIQPERIEGEIPSVNMSLYYNKKNYFIQSICLKDVVDWLVVCSEFLFKGFPYRSTKNCRFNVADLRQGIENFKQHRKKANMQAVGIRIEYKNSELIRKRAAVGQYLGFLCQTNKSVAYLNNHKIIKKIKTENPKHWLPRYVISVPLTGCTALQIQANKENEAIYMLLDCLLTVPDLGKIFNVSIPTVKKMIKSFKYNNGFYYEATSVRRYYSIEATNNLLREIHHHKKKLSKS